jgi:hypothetical protein
MDNNNFDYRPGERAVIAREKSLTWVAFLWTVFTVSIGAVIGACSMQIVSVLTADDGMIHPSEKPLVDKIIACDAKGWIWDMGKCWPPRLADKK